MVVIRKSIPLALFTLGLVAWGIAGCSNSNAKWVGTWTGEMKGLAVGDSTEAKTLRKVTLTIKGDGTFDLKKGLFPVSGNIALGESSSRLNVTHILDKPLESQPEDMRSVYADIRVNYEPDGTLRLIDRYDFGREPVTLTKVPEDSEQP